MRVMIDTNVLISALLFPGSRVHRALEDILASHALVISSFVVDELRAVVQRKFPGKAAVIDALLEQMAFELVYTPENIEPGLFEIRDPKDYPVLYTAITNGVDVLVTGDKDFSGIGIEMPEILTPAEYLEKYAARD